MTKNALGGRITRALYGGRRYSEPTKAPGYYPNNTLVNVTPAAISLDPAYGAGQNFGIETVQADPANPGHVYFHCHLQGIWKSTNYGVTWIGPINTGTNGSAMQSSGGITVVPVGAGSPPIIYAAFIRGSNGLWKSTDGGVNWVQLTGPGYDPYPVVVNPYDSTHLICAAHEADGVSVSFNSGSSWTAKTVPKAIGNGTAFLTFVDTGNSTTTANTWLWMAQAASGVDGTYRTTNGGTNWTNVDFCEHPHGVCQYYNAGSGVIWMAGVYSSLGWGTLRSTDSGATWTHYGPNDGMAVVWGTPSKIYAADGGASNGSVSLKFSSATAPGTGTWSADPGAPTSVNSGAHQTVVLNNGSNNIFLMSMGNGGIWRYIEG